MCVVGRHVVLPDPDDCLVRRLDAEEVIDEEGVSVQVGGDVLVVEGQYAAGIHGLEVASDADVADRRATVDGCLSAHGVGRVERQVGEGVVPDDAHVSRMKTG